MDCFYAAVSIRENPSLENKPVAVGHVGEVRGVICSANYIARQYGVRSAMSTKNAFELCPDLTITPVEMSKYKDISAQISEIYYNYTKKVEKISLDEAYLDVTDVDVHNNIATEIAASIRAEIYQKHFLTASAGIAPNKFLAKIASDWNKPNGQYVIKPGQIDQFISILPVNKIPGVGKVTNAKLEGMKIYTCSDLQKISLNDLLKSFGVFGEKLYDYSRGIDMREVEYDKVSKSLSVEKTFSVDIENFDECLSMLDILYEELLKRLEKHAGEVIKNQFIRVKFNNFVKTTAEVISPVTNLEIFRQLLHTAYNRHNLPVRLIGIGVHFNSAKTENTEKRQLLLEY